MSRCSGNCEECKYSKPVPGTEYRIDREPAMFCSLYDSVSYDEGYKDGMKDGLNAEGFQAGYEYGYRDALEKVRSLLDPDYETKVEGLFEINSRGEDPEKEVIYEHC